MKNLKIYKGEDLILSICVNDYEIDSYSNSVDIICKVEEIETTYTIPVNKGYKLFVEL